MKRPGLAARLPLLSKELIEQAQRRRTYVLRTIYGGLLFTVSLFFMYQLVSRGGEVHVAALSRGHGAKLFQLVVWAQAAGLFIFVPALMADAITRERERNCLDLLVLTDLSPWDIVLQKFLSRVLPMATFLTLSMPLLAVSMAYGGVTADMVWSAAYVLLLTCAQVGAVSLHLSADSPTASAALLSIFVRLPIHTVLLGGLGLLLSVFLGPPLGMPIFTIPASGCLVPALVLFGEGSPPLLSTILFTLPALASVCLYLRSAQRTVSRVAFSNPSLPVEPSFKLAEVPTHRARRSTADLPGAEPVAWRETSSRLMAQLRAVFGVAMLLNLPLALLITASIGSLARDARSSQNKALPYLVGALWLFACAALGLMSVSAFARERAGQTLEVLLSTPLSTREILRQKLAAVHRCARMALAPLGITVLVEAVLEAHVPPRGGFRPGPDTALYLVSSAASLAVYLPLTIWSSSWIGLKVRDRGRGALLVLGGLFAWVFGVPFLIRLAVDGLGGWCGEAGVYLNYLHLLSPATIVSLNELQAWSQFGPEPAWAVAAVNFTVYGGLLLWLRRFTLRNADRLLGRIPEPAVSPVTRATAG